MMSNAKDLHKISNEHIDNSMPVDSGLSLAEIELQLEQRAKGGMYNYFYYITNPNEVTMLSNYFSSLGFEISYIPANSSAPYLGIVKISW